MKNFGKWILGAAVVAGGLGLGATTVQAAEFGVYVRGPVAYVPPCPGAGYVWVGGYYNRGYWVPGYWNYVGVAYRHYDRDDYRGWDRDRDFYRDHDFDRDRDRRYYDRDDRHFDRDHDHDHFRR
jgi:hypothetical protein